MYRMSSPTSGGSSGALLRPVKATLLYYEAYRALDFYRPAPAGLLRAAQDPEADLEVMSAMLLEQAKREWFVGKFDVSRLHRLAGNV